MLTVLTYLQTLALAVLVGKVVLLSFVVAPLLARNLDPEPFGRVVRALFPQYYGLGMGAAAVGLLTTGCLAMLQTWTEAAVLAVVCWGVVLGIETYCRTPLTPQINALRDRMKEQEASGAAEPALRARWESLHRRSVQLNSLARIIHDGSSRNRGVASRDGQAQPRGTEAYLKQYVEGLSGEHARLAAGNLRPGLSQQRIRDCSRSVHE